MFCEVCGRPIKNEDANFCEYCGASLRENKTEDNLSSVYQQNEAISQGETIQMNQPAWQGSVYQKMAQDQKQDVQQSEKPVSFLTWLGTLLLGIVPFVNIVYVVLLFVWAFSEGNNVTRKNWARAQLVVSLISIVVAFIFVVVVISGVLSSGMTMDDYLNATYY